MVQYFKLMGKQVHVLMKIAIKFQLKEKLKEKVIFIIFFSQVKAHL